MFGCCNPRLVCCVSQRAEPSLVRGVERARVTLKDDNANGTLASYQCLHCSTANLLRWRIPARALGCAGEHMPSRVDMTSGKSNSVGTTNRHDIRTRGGSVAYIELGRHCFSSLRLRFRRAVGVGTVVASQESEFGASSGSSTPN